MQQTTLQALQTYTETNQAFSQIAKLEQNLSIRQSIQNAQILCQESTKIDAIRQIIRIVEFFLKVTGKELEPYQIQILAGDLYEKFQYDTMDDIILLFKMARQGDFGKVYRCDTLEIMNWANLYLDIKAEEREKLYYDSKAKLTEKQGFYFHELPKEMQNKFNAILKKRTVKEEYFLPPRITDFLTQQKHRDQIAKAIKEDENDKTNPKK
ncbi:hypothetical protein [Riemerella columbipharyngis]|uniref:Uncharacterized protein n=1 Tax=Riemerella columbipharyngis TaxID=1071918 RepID=A0A1G7FY82_9FLAO|nr:hypothetical protein [Riemerella columbipharyngis]SDE80827.1 hypothetical protein SAMN05421544_1323 [Riemerella columbipharyngis]